MPIKVLMLIDGLFAGGKERRLIELLKGLSVTPNVDYEVVILSDVVTYDEIYQLKGKVHCIVRKSKKDFSVLGKLHRICKSFQPDIIQAWESMAAVYGVIAAKRVGARFINASITTAKENIRPFSSTWIRAKLTFLFADAVIGNSQAGLDSFDAPADKSYCIRNGFDFKRMEKLVPTEEIKASLGIDRDTQVVGMVGEFHPRKDYKTFMHAALSVLEETQNVFFLGIGGGVLKPEMESLIPDKYRSSFQLINWQKNVESYINIFDVGVMASHREGISNAIIEYMVLGLPVVATGVGGTPELVVDDETGFLVSKGNVDQMVEKIKLLLADKEKAVAMGQKGKERIYNHFSLDKMVDTYIRLYQHLTTKGTKEKFLV
ncbi:glycosyltransferase [Fulvivirgaceae bacterium BMA12]|uniref:Glycosyltransferase n=1 Tax=Agaribacillus aureus TaxID=3051825 RepID=A0ABT8L8U1_9BACT|nr:glycosyltransferase [Fulvivirgaceae bacterium BMA12]